MNRRARFCCFVACTLTATLLEAQPLRRTAASSLRLGATPPSTNYATARAFPSISFTQPVSAVTPPGETRRLFVVEKTGRIYVIPDVTAASPARGLFLDLTASVAVSSDLNDERGLLALAFHPDYARNGQFYVWYTTNTTTAAGGGLHNRLARFHVSAADPNIADAGSEQPLISQRDEAGNHNGGEILFGPDGYLYLSLGDEGGGNDQFQNSQRIDRDFFAGVIRIDVDRRSGSLSPNPHAAVHVGTYSIPADNPFVGATSFNGVGVNPLQVRTEFWATGLRNPWRMSFDPATGRLWCADVGQGTREEVNVILRGANYGWNYREGLVAGPRGNPPAGAAFVPPIWDYGRSDGASVTGGRVYRGSRYAGLVGHYLFADFVSGRIWALNPDGENTVGANRVQLLATDGGVAGFGLDPSTGEILLCDLAEGALKRLVANTTVGGTPLPATLAATGAFSSVATLTPAAGVVPYEPNVSFWSDYATKRRWFALPDTTSRFGFAAEGPWSLRTGAVWVKHFDLELTRGNPATARRVETRFLVKTANGTYGLTYQWNEAQTDATLVPEEGAGQNFTVTENGIARSQTWRFPSRGECQTCHTSAGGHALSFNTRQLNRNFAFPDGSANIITALVQAGYLEAPPDLDPSSLPALVASTDPTTRVEARARAYLDVNCSQCHQPGGTALGAFDARASTPLLLANILNGSLVDHGGDLANRVLVPGDLAHSRILQRMSVRGTGQMPPVGTNERDLAGETLIRQWITALAEGGSNPNAPPSRLVNLAARAQVGINDNVLISGFVIGPGAPKNVLIRAVGPSLAAEPFLLSGVLTDPQLTILGPNSDTRVAASNNDWLAEDASRFTATGAFALAARSRDAAVFANLAPGSYTAQVTGFGGTTGLALVEVYDADEASNSSVARASLVNIAVRAQVGTDENVLIPGLVVGAGAPKTVLIRAIGPGLSGPPFNVPGALAEPIVTLFAGTQNIASNRGWNSTTNAMEIRAAAVRVSAFALAENSRDSAMLITLPPGAYTIQVAGASGSTGIALVEVYEVP